MCAHAQTQDSLPGTRQQCTAKWDVWEPPAAKRRTGRRNKPSLMETWHARRGGNSNKRLMGHGAFSAAAKYAPLLPLSALPRSRSVPCWPRGSDISRPRPLPRGDMFLPPPYPNSTEKQVNNRASESLACQEKSGLAVGETPSRLFHVFNRLLFGVLSFTPKNFWTETRGSVLIWRTTVKLWSCLLVESGSALSGLQLERVT